jgi:hypothetical protein
MLLILETLFALFSVSLNTIVRFLSIIVHNVKIMPGGWKLLYTVRSLGLAESIIQVIAFE